MLLPVDLAISADVALAVPALLSVCRELVSSRADLREALAQRHGRLSELHRTTRERWRREAENDLLEGLVRRPSLARVLGDTIRDDDWVLANGNLSGWTRRLWDWDKPYRYVSSPGLGHGIGVSIGAALAYKESDRLVVDVQADGDLLYTSSGLWTAVHHKIPLLVVMYNNRSYYNDEVHQESVAITRRRSVDNKTIGIRLEDPPVDYAGLARSMGMHAEGPVDNIADVRGALGRAAQYVREHRLPALVDVLCAREARPSTRVTR
jgi:thiamine pyrophosphate-dependent acetolactate synthase large subunit-like protein